MTPENPKAPERAARTFWLLDNHVFVLADHNDTGGRYDLIEELLPAGAEGPLHRHTRYTEHIYVLEGELTVWLEGRTTVLGVEESITIPLGAAHVGDNTGDGPVRVLMVASPSGYARLAEEAGIPDTDGTPPPPGSMDMDLFGRVLEETGNELLGPPGTRP